MQTQDSIGFQSKRRGGHALFVAGGKAEADDAVAKALRLQCFRTLSVLKVRAAAPFTARALVYAFVGATGRDVGHKFTTSYLASYLRHVLDQHRYRIVHVAGFAPASLGVENQAVAQFLESILSANNAPDLIVSGAVCPTDIGAHPHLHRRARYVSVGHADGDEIGRIIARWLF